MQAVAQILYRLIKSEYVILLKQENGSLVTYNVLKYCFSLSLDFHYSRASRQSLVLRLNELCTVYQ